MIGIRNSDNTITAIYCHWDGYVEKVGNLLFKYYSNEDTIKELVSNGNLSSLREKIHPDNTYEHSYVRPQRDVCIFYIRDRKESQIGNLPVTYKSDSAYINGVWVDYYYLFFDGAWHYSRYTPNSWKKVNTDNV